MTAHLGRHTVGSFRIGDAHVSVAGDATKLVSVFNNGAPVRTMPASMGMGGTQAVGGRTISLWTPPGVYTVLGKGNPAVMDSSTFGLPKNSRLGYRETINYAARIGRHVMGDTQSGRQQRLD